MQRIIHVYLSKWNYFECTQEVKSRRFFSHTFYLHSSDRSFWVWHSHHHLFRRYDAMDSFSSIHWAKVRHFSVNVFYLSFSLRWHSHKKTRFNTSVSIKQILFFESNEHTHTKWYLIDYVGFVLCVENNRRKKNTLLFLRFLLTWTLIAPHLFPSSKRTKWNRKRTEWAY